MDSGRVFARVLEESAEPAVAPSLTQIVMQKSIVDSVYTTGTICNFPLNKIRSQLKQIENLHNTLQHVPPNKMDIKSSSMKAACMKVPGFDSIADLMDPEKVKCVLNDLLTKEIEVNTLSAVLDMNYKALKYARYIHLDWKLPCQVKCVPACRLEEYTKAILDPLGLEPVSVKNNEKRTFTQVNSMKHYSSNGLETIDCMPLEFARIYPLGPDEGLGYNYAKIMKVVSTNKHIVTHREIYDPDLKDQHYSGITLCTKSRMCYNYGTLTSEDLKQGITSVNCGSCGSASNSSKIGDFGICDMKTCLDGFIDECFGGKDDHEPKNTPESHTEFVQKVKSYMPLMKAKLCTGCFIFLSCTHRHHDSDVVHLYLRTIALPLLTPKTKPVEFDQQEFYFPTL